MRWYLSHFHREMHKTTNLSSDSWTDDGTLGKEGSSASAVREQPETETQWTNVMHLVNSSDFTAFLAFSCFTNGWKRRAACSYHAVQLCALCDESVEEWWPTAESGRSHSPTPPPPSTPVVSLTTLDQFWSLGAEIFTTNTTKLSDCSAASLDNSLHVNMGFLWHHTGFCAAGSDDHSTR